MLAEHIHPHDCLVEIGVCTLSDVIVKVFLIPQRIQTLEYKFEKRLQVLWAGTRHEDISVAVPKCGSNCKSKGCGFASSASSSKDDCAGEGLFCDCIDKGQ